MDAYELLAPKCSRICLNEAPTLSSISAHQGQQIYPIKFKQGDFERIGWFSSSKMSFWAIMRMEHGCNV